MSALLAYFVRRLAQSLVVLLVMSALVFAAVYVIGNPVDILIDPNASQAEIARVTAILGLDRPLPVQYWRFLAGAVHGNLGTSFVANVSAMQLVLQRLPATLELAVTATLIALLAGVPLGLWAGMRPRSWSARLIMGGSVLGFSLPTFWVGVLLVSVFSVGLGWLPPAGRGATVDVLGVRLSLFTWDGLRHALLPALNLALFQLALMIRLTRAGAADAYAADYVRYARAKGLTETRIALAHVLRNIAIPIVTVAGLEFGSVIAYSIVTETIFAWPGMGKLLIDSINQLDRPVIVAYLMLVLAIFVAINFVLDLAYTALDPRVRLSGGVE
jgi:peptide/nickel transport system permease protein